MKSVPGSSELNIVEYEGDMVPRTDIDPEFGAIWGDFDEDTSEDTRRSNGRTALDATALDNLPEVEEEPILPWQHDLIIQTNLGIDRFSPEDYRSLPITDYDMWQRILRKYCNSLDYHAKSILNVDGEFELLDYKLQKLYGVQDKRTLLEYAAKLAKIRQEIEDHHLIDPMLAAKLTRRKLENAPDYRTVRVTKDDRAKLHLHTVQNQQQIA